MFKYHKGMELKSVCDLFTPSSSTHTCSNKDQIRSAYGKHKFYVCKFLCIVALAILVFMCIVPHQQDVREAYAYFFPEQECDPVIVLV